MPTTHPRISVTKDPDLAEMMARARGAFEEELSEAALVRALMVAGAEAMEEREARRRRSIAELADPDLGGLDLDVLETVEDVGMHS